jgi:hypothetical protein
MFTSKPVSQMTYMSKEVVGMENMVELEKLIVDQRIAELRHEGDVSRRLRVIDGVRPQPIAWPTRARRRLGATLVAAGETLRGSDFDPTMDRAA